MRTWAKAVLEALQGLVQALLLIAERLTADGLDSLAARVQELELSRARWEAEAEGQLMKAEGVFKAARASEERQRHAGKRRLFKGGDDEEADPGDEAEAIREQLAAAYAQGGGGGAVSPLHSRVEMDPREAIRQRKWGR